ncbi:hypothetical protein DEO72_LG5g1209 [Vigna unguiculata]|uniref:Uncharacterized protein n=1 Tax=Vigna unguiculata TaxID=3917 RepID=A0A4D6LXS0_VIGUN|nr:hypothetical protein DEO72_LG5g1209 [Vigna unguiculata]
MMVVSLQQRLWWPTVEDGGAVVLHMKCGVECILAVVFATSARTEKMMALSRFRSVPRCCSGCCCRWSCAGGVAEARCSVWRWWWRRARCRDDGGWMRGAVAAMVVVSMVCDGGAVAGEIGGGGCVEGGREIRVRIATWHDLVEWSLSGRRGAT